ncbi:MAG: hypothetical protein KBF32_02540 [Chitinophagales bacterium]|nr:hypothetical protein [Chitinophagales bacterium]
MGHQHTTYTFLIRLLLCQLFLFSVLLTNSESILAQQSEKSHVYEIYKGNDKIGQVVAITVTDGKKKFIRIETHIDVRVLFTVKVDVVVKNNFVDEALSEVSVRRVINGSVKINNTIVRSEKRYQMINMDKDTTFYNGTIGKCVSQLYFEEPVNLSSIFSEAFLKPVPLVKTGASTYQLKLPDGNINHYTYVNGVCTMVTIETSMATVKLKLVDIPAKQ